MPRVKKFKKCANITEEDNNLLYELIGEKCDSICTSLVDFYETPRDRSAWKTKWKDVICFVKDHTERSYFYRLYSLKDEKLIWEFELPPFLVFEKSNATFFTFPFSNCVQVGFLFKSPDETEDFHQNTVKITERLNSRSALSEVSSVQTKKVSENQYHRDPTMNLKKKKLKGKKISLDDIGRPKQDSYIHVNPMDPEEIVRKIRLKLSDVQDPKNRPQLEKLLGKDQLDKIELYLIQNKPEKVRSNFDRSDSSSSSSSRLSYQSMKDRPLPEVPGSKTEDGYHFMTQNNARPISMPPIQSRPLPKAPVPDTVVNGSRKPLPALPKITSTEQRPLAAVPNNYQITNPRPLPDVPSKPVERKTRNKDLPPIPDNALQNSNSLSTSLQNIPKSDFSQKLPEISINFNTMPKNTSTNDSSSMNLPRKQSLPSDIRIKNGLEKAILENTSTFSKGPKGNLNKIEKSLGLENNYKPPIALKTVVKIPVILQNGPALPLNKPTVSPIKPTILPKLYTPLKTPSISITPSQNPTLPAAAPSLPKDQASFEPVPNMMDQILNTKLRRTTEITLEPKNQRPTSSVGGNDLLNRMMDIIGKRYAINGSSSEGENSEDDEKEWD